MAGSPHRKKLPTKSREAPAKCLACGRLVHVIASTSSGIFVVGVLLFTGSAILAVATASYWVFVAGLALVVAYNLWAWRRVDLYPIPVESAKAAAQVSWWLLLSAALLKLLS